MSTYYRDLKSPWTDIVVEKVGKHSKIKLWQDHGLAGELTVDEEVEAEVIEQFFGEETHQTLRGHGDQMLLRRLLRRPPRTDKLLSDSNEIQSYYKLIAECDIYSDSYHEFDSRVDDKLKRT